MKNGLIWDLVNILPALRPAPMVPPTVEVRIEVVNADKAF